MTSALAVMTPLRHACTELALQHWRAKAHVVSNADTVKGKLAFSLNFLVERSARAASAGPGVANCHRLNVKPHGRPHVCRTSIPGVDAAIYRRAAMSVADWGNVLVWASSMQAILDTRVGCFSC